MVFQQVSIQVNKALQEGHQNRFCLRFREASEYQDYEKVGKDQQIKCLTKIMTAKMVTKDKSRCISLRLEQLRQHRFKRLKDANDSKMKKNLKIESRDHA